MYSISSKRATNQLNIIDGKMVKPRIRRGTSLDSSMPDLASMSLMDQIQRSASAFIKTPSVTCSTTTTSTAAAAAAAAAEESPLDHELKYRSSHRKRRQSKSPLRSRKHVRKCRSMSTVPSTTSSTSLVLQRVMEEGEYDDNDNECLRMPTTLPSSLSTSASELTTTNTIATLLDDCISIDETPFLYTQLKMEPKNVWLRLDLTNDRDQKIDQNPVPQLGEILRVGEFTQTYKIRKCRVLDIAANAASQNDDQNNGPLKQRNGKRRRYSLKCLRHDPTMIDMCNPKSNADDDISFSNHRRISRRFTQQNLQPSLLKSQSLKQKQQSPIAVPTKEKHQEHTKQLLKEAMYLSILDHPHILKARIIPKLTSQTPFSVSDQIGQTLEERMLYWRRPRHNRQKKRSASKRKKLLGGNSGRTFEQEEIYYDYPQDLTALKTNYVLQIANALVYLHQRGIVVRNLRPDTIGFLEHPYHHCLKILDLTAAKELPLVDDPEIQEPFLMAVERPMMTTLTKKKKTKKHSMDTTIPNSNDRDDDDDEDDGGDSGANGDDDDDDDYDDGNDAMDMSLSCHQSQHTMKKRRQQEQEDMIEMSYYDTKNSIRRGQWEQPEPEPESVPLPPKKEVQQPPRRTGRRPFPGRHELQKAMSMPEKDFPSRQFQFRRTSSISSTISHTSASSIITTTTTTTTYTVTTNGGSAPYRRNSTNSTINSLDSQVESSTGSNNKSLWSKMASKEGILSRISSRTNLTSKAAASAAEEGILSRSSSRTNLKSNAATSQTSTSPSVANTSSHMTSRSARRAYNYCAPELYVLDSENGEVPAQYNAKADVYSLAIIYFELLADRKAFPSASPVDHLFRIRSEGMRPSLRSCYFPLSVQQIIKQAWLPNVDRRMTSEKMVKSVTALLHVLEGRGVMMGGGARRTTSLGDNNNNCNDKRISKTVTPAPILRRHSTSDLDSIRNLSIPAKSSPSLPEQAARLIRSPKDATQGWAEVWSPHKDLPPPEPPKSWAL